MTISKGDRLPEAQLLKMGDGGPEPVSLASLTAGKRVALFGVPGAYTGVCTTAHVPSFVRTKDQFAEKGVEEVICVAVNDPFVMDAWGKETGAAEAGLHMLGDADGGLIRAMGLDFDAPPAGLHGRSQRFALLATDGVVDVIHVEESPGACEASAGEALLAEV
jgi:peroxiredoxin